MNRAALKARACAEVDALRPAMDAVAHAIHDDPEVGWETPRSAARLEDFLEAEGMAVERDVVGLPCAFRAAGTAAAGGGHPAVAFLAEYDALPKVGHGCGHNLIGATACGAGIAVSRILAAAGLPGTAYVMGTPFEEGGGGKIVLLERGVFDGVDASLMFHPGTGGEVRAGSPNNACHFMTFRYYGKAAHTGAAPWEGVNAADAAMFFFAAVNALRQHLTADVRVSGVIREGGESAGIVPDYAEVPMPVRGRSYRSILPVIEKVKDCARAGALATGCRLEIDEGPTFLEHVLLDSYRALVNESLPEMGVPPIAGVGPHVTASADSGNISQKLPHLTLGLPIEMRKDVALHTTAFAAAADSDLGRDAMNRAAKVLAMCALDLIAEPERLAAIRAEHRAKTTAAAAG